MDSFNSADDLLADYQDEEYLQIVAAQQEALSITAKEEADGDPNRVDSLSAAFNDFLLKPELIRAVIGCGFETPSEVQQACIPIATHGVDVLCQAKPGMGKPLSTSFLRFSKLNR